MSKDDDGWRDGRVMRDYDPRVVDLYDGDNPDGPDHDYYRGLAASEGAKSILDIGCGTGILTATLAGPGRTVVGVDPSRAMIEYARRRPGAERVTWIHGDASAVSEGPFDFALMTGNVAQHIPDPDWELTLRVVRRVLRPGGLLAFESRNPAARAWEQWDQPIATTRETMHGPLTEWMDVIERGHGRVLLRAYNRFEATGDVVIQEELLTFRDADVLADQLRRHGFEVRAIWGDWAKTPFDGSQPLMVFEACASRRDSAP